MVVRPNGDSAVTLSTNPVGALPAGWAAELVVMPTGQVLDAGKPVRVTLQTGARTAAAYLFAGTGAFVGEQVERLAPAALMLEAPYPNPFNGVVTIQYALPQQSDVRLDIYNIVGQRVATVVAGVVAAGYHEAAWDGRDAGGRVVGSGLYLVRLATAEAVLVQRMVVLR